MPFLGFLLDFKLSLHARVSTNEVEHSQGRARTSFTAFRLLRLRNLMKLALYRP